MKSKFWSSLILGLFLLGHQSTASSQSMDLKSPSLYDDPRVKLWSKAYLNRQFEEVSLSVAKDLRSATPHPFAPHVWTVTQATMGRLSKAWSSVDDQLRKALGPLPELYLLYQRGEARKILATYPPQRANEISDVWALHFIAFSAYDERRFQEMYVYSTRMAKLRPDLFQAIWATLSAYEEDLRLRPKVAALIAPGGELAGTPFARFHQSLVNVRTGSQKTYLQAVTQFLKEFPNDARALRFLGTRLEVDSEYQEAAQTYEKQVEAYPFKTVAFPNWDSQAQVLLKAKDEEAAFRIIARSAQFEAAENGEEVLLLEKVRRAAVFRQVERFDDAKAVLEEALKQWPNSASANSEMASFYLALRGSESLALPFALKAAELEPAKVSHQLQLIKALHQSGDSARSYSLFLKVENSFPKSPDMYAAVEDTFINPKLSSAADAGFFGESSEAAVLRSKEFVQVMTRAVAEYPESAWMLRMLTEAYVGDSRYPEALASLQRSFEIYEPYRWSINILNKILAETKGNNAVAIRDVKYALIDQFPQNTELLAETRDDLLNSVGNHPSEVPDLMARARRGYSSELGTANNSLYRLVSLLKYDCPTDSGILFYAYDGDVLREWLFNSTGIKAYYQAKIPIARINSAATRFRESFIGNTGNSGLDANKELSSLLFPPSVVQQLTKREEFKHLIIVPPREMSLVPFGALRPEGLGTQLIDVLPVSVVRNIADLNQRVEPWTSGFVRPLVVQGALESSPTDNQIGQSALSRIFRTVSSVEHSAANETPLEKIRMADFIVFSNAMAGDATKKSLVLRLPNGAQTRWTQQQIQETELNARVVVLNGYSAGEKEMASTPEELTIALQKAGVTQVLVSLWPIESHEASEFLEFFVSELKQAPPTNALRQATLRFKRQRPNSSQWASFTLVGSPRLMNTFETSDGLR